jgi:four helix bundle protein
MSIRDHRDLEVWRLADEIRGRIVALVKRPEVRGDFGFCNQADRTASSVCRNITEGFYRFSHPEFAHFVKISRGSLGELLDSVNEAQWKGYVNEEEARTLETLIRQAMSKARALHKHLISTPTPDS